jgi:hypothetical protein
MTIVIIHMFDNGTQYDLTVDTTKSVDPGILSLLPANIQEEVKDEHHSHQGND